MAALPATPVLSWFYFRSVSLKKLTLRSGCSTADPPRWYSHEYLVQYFKAHALYWPVESYSRLRAFGGLGGPDPLDFVHILSHSGDPTVRSPSHWHYITCGFSDLYGDGRIHQFSGSEERSGFGFELTFRLKKKKGEDAPLWPATLLNVLARYVFKTGNTLNCADVVPWQTPLDEGSDSIITDIMLTEDEELREIKTPHGRVQFRQIVGVTNSEILTAQKWNGNGVLGLLSKVPETGGGLLVTDMDREYSLQDYNPQLRLTLPENVTRDGSNMGHMTAVCMWQESPEEEDEEDDEERVITQATITIDADAAAVLPLMIAGRLMKGRFFVFQNISGQVIIFIPPEFNAEMVIVTAQEPLKAQGQVLQVYCSKEFTAQMGKQLTCCLNVPELKKQLPRTFHLRSPNIILKIVPNGEIPVIVTP